MCTEAMDLTVLLSTAILQRLNCVYKAKINVRKYILACFDLIPKIIITNLNIQYNTK